MNPFVRDSVTFRVESYGPSALLVRFSNQADDGAFVLAQTLLRHLEACPPAGLREATPGFTTVLLEFEPGASPDAAEISSVLQNVLHPTLASPSPLRTVEIPVVYDGPDLDRVASQGGLTRREVVELHTAAAYRVQILGFSPGFPYLAGLDPRLHVPRMATPRLRVPAGSVAIGGEHTGIYPVATAGGWNIIGHTTLRLVDLKGAAEGDAGAFLLHPGDGVRFVAVSGNHAASDLNAPSTPLVQP